MTPIGAKAVLNIIRRVLPGLVRREISSRRIMRTLRGAGLHLRTTDFMEEIRQARGVWKGEQWARAAPSTEIYKKGRMVEEDLRFPAKYRVYFDLEVHNIQTDEAYIKTVSVYTDQYTSPQGWCDEFMQNFAEGMCDPETAIDKITMRNVRHNIGQPY